MTEEEKIKAIVKMLSKYEIKDGAEYHMMKEDIARDIVRAIGLDEGKLEDRLRLTWQFLHERANLFPSLTKAILQSKDIIKIEVKDDK